MVVVIALTAVLALVAVLGIGVAGLFSAHRRVAAAADLAALAGAVAQQRGEEPCAAAARIATANGADLIACLVRIGSVEVTARLEPGGFLQGAELLARARAGTG